MNLFRYIFQFLLVSSLGLSSLGLAEEVNFSPLTRKMNQRFFENILRKRQCQESQSNLAACLRGLNDMMAEWYKKDVLLLHRSQLNKAWVPVLDDQRNAVFETENLVLAELSVLGRSQVKENKIVEPLFLYELKKDLDLRYSDFAEFKISEDDIQIANEFILSKVHSDQDARRFATAYLSAQIKELLNDPFAEVSEVTETKTKTANRPIAGVFKESHYILTRVRPGSFYDKAGVTVGMAIEKVGDTNLTEDNFDWLYQEYLRNPEIGLTIRLKDGRRFKIFEGVKEKEIPGIYTYSFNLKNKKILVLDVVTFNLEDLCISFKKTIEAEMLNQPDGVIVDLRYNGGGQISAVLCMAGLLFGKDVVVTKEKYLEGTPMFSTYASDDKDSKDLVSTEGKIVPNIPITFLINSYSASGSEMLSGFAQDTERSWVVGARSFGKGIGQSTSEASIDNEPVDNLNVKTTYMRYSFPSGRTPQLIGVEPDFNVPSSIAGASDEKYALRFTNYLGNQYGVDQEPRRVSPERLKKKAAIQKCIQKNNQLQINQLAFRHWFADEQLRIASLVNYCE